MRVLAIVHEAEAGPGVFADAIRERGGTLDEWMVPESVEPPADPLGYDAAFVLGGSMNADEGERFHWIVNERELIGRLL
jgi:GMP synthase-like glutamine amidotransferase